MSGPTTATRWAWEALARRYPTGRGLDVPHKLTLLAAADLLDVAAEASGRAMFHHDVLDLAVAGFDAADLSARLGVTERTAVLYCRVLAKAGLLETRDARHFTLPAHAWSAATDPS